MGCARFACHASNISALREVPHDAKAADKEDAVEGGAVERGQSGRVFGQFSRRFVVPKGCGRGSPLVAGNNARATAIIRPLVAAAAQRCGWLLS